MDSFYIIDLMIGAGILLAVAGLYTTGRMSRFKLWLFIAGCVIGAFWEFPLHFAGPEYSDDPIYIQLTEFPLPPILQPALHCIWDGALFLISALLVERFTGPPHFTRFRWPELSVLLIWGLASALVIELIGSMGGWVYTVRWWNPALIEVNSGAITLLPLLIWTVAPIVFYVVALYLRQRTTETE
jgi:hypothetical protein